MIFLSSGYSFNKFLLKDTKVSETEITDNKAAHIRYQIMKLSLLFVLAALLLSCTNQMDGAGAAKQYCECMKLNKSDEQYGYAYTVCSAELAKKYRYYRIFYIDTKDKEFNVNLPQATRDSTNRFIGDFLDYRNANNCAP
ncbi:hypothetical protein [Pedobacter miscanthi]|uniref:Uncharacterized protein n=1 Tax=Pedobacter miscanthi TaxID=2259170 RepID=A0A366KKI9_9SPHI|nr:hypothetical protein [Pedobacter miscanthi]RBQ02221.1 hypothetical protein DRW42_27905 [Pedobacter miscanthi]